VNDWSRAVFARAMIADYGATKNPAILESLTRNYLTTPRLYGGTLACTNIEVLCWLYAQTGNRALLEMAEESYRKGDQQRQILNPAGHAVCYCEKPRDDTPGARIILIWRGRRKQLMASSF
jgi:hypothetical protein